MSVIELGPIRIQVQQKDIQNIHLSVHPPHGAVRISAPERMDMDTIRIFALSKLPWIKKQQQSLRAQQCETPREYLDRESHYFLGQRYQLKVIERPGAPKIQLGPKQMKLHIRPGTTESKRQQLIENWYRSQLKVILPPMIEKWAKRIGIPPPSFGIKKMRTKWGSCNAAAQRIWLNLELARKPLGCLEYIVVHELVHFLERSHGPRFVELMDRVLPQWRQLREELNRLPFRHVGWGY